MKAVYKDIESVKKYMDLEEVRKALREAFEDPVKRKVFLDYEDGNITLAEALAILVGTKDDGAN
jgi:hypothetical protein